MVDVVTHRRPYLCVPLRGKRGGVALVTEGFWPLVDRYYWYESKNGYAFSPKVGLMHRRLFAAESGEDVDHKNFNRLDNRHENLRSGPPALNRRNVRQRADSKQPFKGVRARKRGTFSARIGIDGRQIYLGTFATAIEAARAYDRAAREYHGPFANFNLTDGCNE